MSSTRRGVREDQSSSLSVSRGGSREGADHDRGSRAGSTTASPGIPVDQVREWLELLRELRPTATYTLHDGSLNPRVRDLYGEIEQACLDAERAALRGPG